jgi:hypothetical protein
MGNFSLVRDCTIIVDLGNDILFCWSFPESFRTRFGGSNHKATADIGMASNFLVFLHEGDIQFGVLDNFESELRVVEPSVIAFQLNMLRNLKVVLGVLVDIRLIKVVLSGAF